MRTRVDRRQFLAASLAVPAAAVAISRLAAAQGRARPTPACGDSDLTPPQTEGPYFKPRSPMRSSLLEPGMPGTRIVIEGSVLDTGCAPIPRALIDAWQADDRGDYDLTGFRLRGHQFTDDAGRYRLETLLPGRYPGRTRHVHVKVQAPGQRPLTTQLYFPDDPQNRRDGLFTPELLVKVVAADRRAFDFVLDATRGRS